MPGRDEILAIIDAGYEARVRGDKEKLATFWAPDAQYRMSGDSSLIAAFPAGPANAEITTAELIDRFQFQSLERLAAIVEGNKAAVMWRVTASAGDKPLLMTELFDLFEFDEAGKITSLVQFCDTAALAKFLG
jgi:ketosteroid isomerase-like protein